MVSKLFLHPTRALLLGCLAGLILACGGGGGGGSTAPPTPLPAISSFTATPASITSGSSSSLAWTAAGATSLSLDQGIGSVTGLTTKTVSPAATTTYTLTASNAGGNATATATVTVVAAPVISSFTATPASILDGQSSTLAWTVAGASTLSLDQSIGTVTGTSKTVSPTTTTTYTLTATNALGHVSTATTTVTVNLNLGGTLALTYVSGSSVKLEQVIGDKDWADAAKGITTPTTSQTATRADVLGNGLGASFEGNGQLILLFGDTIGATSGPPNGPAYYPTWVNFANNFRWLGHDPIAWSTSTDPENPLQVTFFTANDGNTLTVEPPGVDMGPDNIPNSGITLDGQMYVVCSTGTVVANGAGDYSNDKSILSAFDPVAKSFTTGRTISQVANGGHFIYLALREPPPGAPLPQPGFPGSPVYLFGLGQYRQSNIYLSVVPKAGFASGAGALYFAGLANGQPTWTSQETAAVSVVTDIVPASPTIGNFSAVYSSTLGLWLMAFDGGRQPGPQHDSTVGFYFTYAKEPWGPWSVPQLMYNETRDHGLGVYIRDPATSAGPAGPTIGDQTQNDPHTTRGGAFAPQLIERFTTVTGNLLKVYYHLSTWNPYTVVRMRSEFIITNP